MGLLQRLNAGTSAHGLLLPHWTVSRLAPQRPIHLSWVCQRLHVCIGSGLGGVVRRLCGALHGCHVERRLLMLALHRHGLEDVKFARFILHRALPVQELHLLVQQASLLLLFPLLDHHVIVIVL